MKSSRREAPFWLDDPDREDAGSIVACRNGLFDISTRKLLPHTSNFFNVNCLTFDYDPEASRSQVAQIPSAAVAWR